MSFGYKTKFSRFNGVSFDQVAGLISIEENEVSRPPVQVTNLDGTSGYHEFSASPVGDPGELSAVLEWDQADTQQAALKTDFEAVTGNQYQVQYPGGETYTFNAFITSWGKTVEMEDRIMRNVTFKLTDLPVEA